MTFLLVWIFPTITKLKDIQKIVESLPPFIKAMLGEELLPITSFEGFMSIRYFNMAVVWIFSIFTILYCAPMISADMETQRIEMVLSQPIRRYEVIIARFAGYFVYLMGLTAIALGALFAGIKSIGIETDFLLILKVFVAFLPLEIAVASVCLFLSCLVDEPLKATFYSLGLFIFFYFLKAILVLTPTMQSLRIFNPFYYFDATSVVKHNSLYPSNMAVLLALGVVFFIASLVYFQKKEIYV